MPNTSSRISGTVLGHSGCIRKDVHFLFSGRGRRSPRSGSPFIKTAFEISRCGSREARRSIRRFFRESPRTTGRENQRCGDTAVLARFPFIRGLADACSGRNTRHSYKALSSRRPRRCVRNGDDVDGAKVTNQLKRVHGSYQAKDVAAERRRRDLDSLDQHVGSMGRESFQVVRIGRKYGRSGFRECNYERIDGRPTAGQSPQ
jgi:hypothetical protein